MTGLRRAITGGRTLAAIAVGVGVVACIAVQPGNAVEQDDAIDSQLLVKGKATVILNQPTRIFECWKGIANARPRLYQRVQTRWRLLDVSTVSRDTATCSRRYPYKAVYDLTITVPGRWNEDKGYYEARVLTACRGCGKYKWKIPVVKEQAPPVDRVYYADCDAARRAGAAPLLIGQPGYRDGLDSDGDGVACELT